MSQGETHDRKTLRINGKAVPKCPCALCRNGYLCPRGWQLIYEAIEENP